MTTNDYSRKLDVDIDYSCKWSGGIRVKQVEQPKISDAEWEVMRVAWSKKEVNSQEIVAVLKDKMDWKPATIKTLIGRLVKKGLLLTKAEGNRYIYFPSVSEADSMISATENLFAHVCSKKIGSTIGTLISEATLTFDDIALLEVLIQKKKAEGVEAIECNCIPGQCECQEH